MNRSETLNYLEFLPEAITLLQRSSIFFLCHMQLSGLFSLHLEENEILVHVHPSYFVTTK